MSISDDQVITNMTKKQLAKLIDQRIERYFKRYNVSRGKGGVVEPLTPAQLKKRAKRRDYKEELAEEFGIKW